jgi:hypothetical protein|nr:MAG TPA: hypothetical protein [Caudoviricetes sp.]
MKIKTTIVRPGTILCWKEYNIFTKLWNKLKKRDLPYNKFEIIPTSIELLTIDKYNFVAYAPIRKYSKQEIHKLQSVYDNCVNDRNWEDIKAIINIVRPNTFNDSSTLEECKYYKKIDLNEESSEYIY